MWLPTQSVRVHWCGICVRFSLNNYRTQASWTWDYIFTTIDSNVAVWLANLPVSIRAQTTLLLSTCHAMVTHWKNCFIQCWYCGKNKLLFSMVKICCGVMRRSWVSPPKSTKASPQQWVHCINSLLIRVQTMLNYSWFVK